VKYRTRGDVWLEQAVKDARRDRIRAVLSIVALAVGIALAARLFIGGFPQAVESARSGAAEHHCTCPQPEDS